MDAHVPTPPLMRKLIDGTILFMLTWILVTSMELKTKVAVLSERVALNASQRDDFKAELRVFDERLRSLERISHPLPQPKEER